MAKTVERTRPYRLHNISVDPFSKLHVVGVIPQG